MQWTKDFYSKTGRWWGPAESSITERDRTRAQAIKRLAPSVKNILELGSGYGNTAAACAEVGMKVIGIEISDRCNFAKKHQEKYPELLFFRKEDFYTVKLQEKFDIVCYWNGFGIGADADQRRLLKRISDEWLNSGGKALIDIANPYVWAKWVGDEDHLIANPKEGYKYNVNQKIDFDPVHNRFIDTWWDSDKPEEKLTQDIRCYSPVDLLLLLEGTRFELEKIEVNGEEIKIEDNVFTSDCVLAQAYEYLAVLKLKK